MRQSRCKFMITVLSLMVTGFSFVGAQTDRATFARRIAASVEDVEPICKMADEDGNASLVLQDSTLVVKMKNLLDGLKNEGETGDGKGLVAQIEAAIKTVLYRTAPTKQSVDVEILGRKLLTNKIKIESLLRSANLPSEIIWGSKLIGEYFSLTNGLLTLRAYEAPRQIKSVNALQSQYTLKVPQSLWIAMNFEEKIGDLVDGDVVGQPTMRELMLSDDLVHSILVSAAANSEATRRDGSAYFEASRCLLASTFSEKFLLQKSLVDSDWNGVNLPVSSEAKACLNVSYGELQKRIKNSISTVSETEFRSSLNSKVFDANAYAGEGFKKLVKEKGFTFEQLLMIYMFPYNYRSVSANLTQDDVDNLESEVNQLMQKLFTQVPYFRALLSGVQSPEFVSILQGINSSCQTYLGARDFDAEVLPLLQRGEGLLLLRLQGFLQSYVGQLSALDDAGLRLALEQMLTFQKYKDLKTILQEYIEQFLGNSVITSQMDLLLSDRLFKIAQVATSQALEDPAVLQLLEDMINQAQQSRNLLGNLANFRQGLFKHSYEVAQRAEKYFNPQTPLKDLPYNPLFLAKLYSAPIAQLSAKNKARMESLLQQGSLQGYVDVWQVIEKKLESEAQALHVTCRLPHIGIRLQDAWSTWTGDRTSVDEKNRFRSECQLMHQVATIMGLKRQEFAENLGDMEPTLREIIDDGAEFEKAIQLYREQLVTETLQNARFLQPRYSLDQSDKKKPFIFQVVSQAQNADSARSAMEWAIRYSNRNLQKDMLAISNAKSEVDFTPFAAKSMMLGELLADFPELKKKHDGIQIRSDRYARMGEEIWGSFSKKMDIAFLGFISVTAGRYLLPLITKAKWAATVAGLAERMNSATGEVANIFFSGFFPYLIVDVGVQSRHYSNYRMNEKEVVEFYFSDALPSRNYYLPGGLPVQDQSVLNFEKFEQQQLLYESLAENAMGEIRSDAFTAVLAGGFYAYALAGGGKAILTSGWRSEKLKAALGDPAQVAKVEKSIEKSFNRDLMRLSSALKRLGQPDSLFLGNLQRSLRAVRSQEGLSRRAIVNAESGYNEIIYHIGTRVESMMKEQVYLRAFAKAVFGPRGQVKDLYEIYEEYVRIFRLNKVVL